MGGRTEEGAHKGFPYGGRVAVGMEEGVHEGRPHAGT